MTPRTLSAIVVLSLCAYAFYWYFPLMFFLGLLCASLTVILFLIGVRLGLTNARIRGWFQLALLGARYDWT